MFIDLKDKIEQFYDLEEKDQNELLLAINERAKNDKEGFKHHLSSIGYGINSKLSIYLEALWKSPKGWDEFIYHLLSKLLTDAENANKEAIEELSSIMYLTQLEEMTNEFYNKSLALLEDALVSPNSEIRKYCSEAILDIKDVGKITLTKSQINKIQKLLEDKNFEIRIYTYSNLKEDKLLPKGFSLKRMDKIRAKIQGMGSLIK